MKAEVFRTAINCREQPGPGAVSYPTGSWRSPMATLSCSRPQSRCSIRARQDEPEAEPTRTPETSYDPLINVSVLTPLLAVNSDAPPVKTIQAFRRRTEKRTPGQDCGFGTPGEAPPTPEISREFIIPHGAKMERPVPYGAGRQSLSPAAHSSSISKRAGRNSPAR